jgi:hypothetical protein
LNQKSVKYRWTSLYVRDRDQQIRLSYNVFAYKKTKNTYKLGDRFFKNSQFTIAHTQIRR